MRVLILFREAFRSVGVDIADQLLDAGLSPVVRINKGSGESLTTAILREIDYADRVLFLWENGIATDRSLALLTQVAGRQAKAIVAWIETPKNELPIETISVDISSTVRSQWNEPRGTELLEALQSAPPKIEPESTMPTQNSENLQDDSDVLSQCPPQKAHNTNPPSPIHQKSESIPYSVDYDDSISLASRSVRGIDWDRDFERSESRKFSKKDPDRSINSTAFAPHAAQPDTSFLVQVCFHDPGEEKSVAAEAAEADTRARKTSSVQHFAVEVGATLSVTLSCADLEETLVTDSVIWRGQREWLYLTCRLSPEMKKSSTVIQMRVLVDNIPIGKMAFTLDCDNANPEPLPQSTELKKFEKAFISYARPDVQDALAAAQMLRIMGVEVFQDVLNLRPGDRWKRELYQNIDVADLFLLCWSRHAQKSKWVIKEALYAADRSAREGAPEIVPYVLDSRKFIDPPPELVDYNFSDPIRNQSAAYQTKTRGFWWR